MTNDLVDRIRLARARAQISWSDIATEIGREPAWTVAALYGQHPMSAEEAAKVGELLGLSTEDCERLQLEPYRGTFTSPVPTDPTIYRLYEALSVYGPAIKELIHEEFGDGIMSAINFKLSVDRRPHEDGDRVVITFDGKFLDYRW